MSMVTRLMYANNLQAGRFEATDIRLSEGKSAVVSFELLFAGLVPAEVEPTACWICSMIGRKRRNQ